MTTQQMIEEIQEKISDKTLSIWCIIRWLEWYWKIYYSDWWVILDIIRDDWEYDAINHKVLFWELYEVIWHPVSLARVLNALDYHPNIHYTNTALANDKIFVFIRYIIVQ